MRRPLETALAAFALIISIDLTVPLSGGDELLRAAAIGVFVACWRPS